MAALAMALGALILGVPHSQESTTPSLAPKPNETTAQQQQQQAQEQAQQQEQADGDVDEGHHPLKKMQKRVLAHEKKMQFEKAQDKMRKVEKARKKNAGRRGEGDHKKKLKKKIKAMEKMKNARARKDEARETHDAEQEETRDYKHALDTTPSSTGATVEYGTPWETSQALIDRDSKICMGWTARAACTFAVSIFLESLGLLDKALAYNSGFVHEYRTDVMDQSFVASAEDCARPGVTAFKIVRNPFARATSSFGHQMHTEFSDRNPQIYWPMTNAMGQTDLQHVSFLQWLRAIRNVTFSQLDIHSRPQATAPERDGRMVFDSVCKLEDELEACLGAVNSRTGANFSVARAAETSASHNVEHQEVSGDDVASQPYGSFPLASADYDGRATQGPRAFPEPSDFYRGPKGAEAAALVVELYNVDFELYKYSTADPTGTGVVSVQERLQRFVKGAQPVVDDTCC